MRTIFNVAIISVMVMTISHAVAGQFTEIRLKILNAYSGKPLTNRTVKLIGSNDAVGRTSRDADIVELTSTTGSDGVANYFLKRPLPNKILFEGGVYRSCGTEGEWSTEKVIRSGAVGDGELCVPKKWHGKFHWQNVTSEPGEIIIFAIPPPRAQW